MLLYVFYLIVRKPLICFPNFLILSHTFTVIVEEGRAVVFYMVHPFRRPATVYSQEEKGNIAYRQSAIQVYECTLLISNIHSSLILISHTHLCLSISRTLSLSHAYSLSLSIYCIYLTNTLSLLSFPSLTLLILLSRLSLPSSLYLSFSPFLHSLLSLLFIFLYVISKYGELEVNRGGILTCKETAKLQKGAKRKFTETSPQANSNK